MNRHKLLTFLLVEVDLLFLTSCGVNTKDWPKIELGFESENVFSANICYERSKNDYVDYLNEETLLKTTDDISELIEIIECFPIKREIEKNVNTTSYAVKIEITFVFNETYKNDVEKIFFFEYGISDSKVVLNNGEIHYLPGRIDIIYENFIKKEK